MTGKGHKSEEYFTCEMLRRAALVWSHWRTINCNLHVRVCPHLREGSQVFIHTREDMMSRHPSNPAVLGHFSEEVPSAGRHK